MMINHEAFHMDTDIPHALNEAGWEVFCFTYLSTQQNAERYSQVHSPVIFNITEDLVETRLTVGAFCCHSTNHLVLSFFSLVFP